MRTGRGKPPHYQVGGGRQPQVLVMQLGSKGRAPAAKGGSPGTAMQGRGAEPPWQSRGSLGSLEFSLRSGVAPFLWRWARPREVSSPLVSARSGWLLLAASLLVSSPRRLSEPQVCRAQGAASQSPRAGQ